MCYITKNCDWDQKLNKQKTQKNYLKAPPRSVHTGTLSSLPSRSHKAMSIPDIAWLDFDLIWVWILNVFFSSFVNKNGIRDASNTADIRFRPCSFIFIRFHPCSFIFIHFHPCSSIFIHFHPPGGTKSSAFVCFRSP